MVMLVVVVLISTAGYIIIEWPRYSFLDALYMTVITISTAGHREVHPLSPAGEVWTMLVLAFGVLTGAVVLSLLGSMMVEGQIRRIFGRRQLNNKIKNLNGHVIVCGLGRMGQRIALELAAAGEDVVAVDSDPDRTAEAEAAGLLYVLGDAHSEEVLTTAGVQRASQLIGTLSSDADNVFVTLTARGLAHDVKIITRAIDPAAEDKLHKAGASIVVCPMEIGASRVVNIVTRPAVVDFVEVAHKGVDLEVDQIELEEDSPVVGKTLRELELPRRIAAQVVVVRRRSGQTVYQPQSNMELHAGDMLVLIGKSGVAEAMRKLKL